MGQLQGERFMYWCIIICRGPSFVVAQFIEPLVPLHGRLPLNPTPKRSKIFDPFSRPRCLIRCSAEPHEWGNYRGEPFCSVRSFIWWPVATLP